MTDVTQILGRMDEGDPHAAAELLPLVYDELRRLAAANLAREKPGNSLEATALVHEAYLRLVGNHRFADRRHFFVVAAEAMRRILIDQARRKQRIRHGGELQRVPLSVVEPASDVISDDLLALDEALERLATIDSLKADVVKLRYFAGFSEAEAAEALGISRSTANRHWQYARAWLIAALAEKE
jgi:RNA polymerase sigma factor (TIGR02999 family)